MRDPGFTLVETIVALGVLAAAALSIAPLIAATGRAVHAARWQTTTVALAVSRMQELRSLMWAYDAAGNPVEDRSTNLASESPSSAGTGLSPSPPNALDENTAGYVDFLDAAGRWISPGPAIPSRAVFVRRWAIDVPPDGSADSLVIQVLVRRVVDDTRVAGRRLPATGAETRLLTLRTRVAYAR